MPDDSPKPDDLTSRLGDPSGPETAAEIDHAYDWARAFVDAGAFVLHLPTRTIGKASRFYDGQGQLYRPAPDKPVTKAPVLEMENGHSFVATASSFIQIEPKQAAFYLAAQATMRDVVKSLSALAAAQGIGAPSALTLVSVALKEQSTTLEVGLRKMRGPQASSDPT